MADETKLLGTSGKEAIPFEYQVEEQKIARKRAMAQAMMAQSLKGVGAPQMFGKHMANPGIAPHLVNALSGYLGQKNLAGADAEQTAMGQRMRADQGAEMSAVQGLMRGQPGQITPQAGPPMEGQAELPPIEVGGVKPDLRGALAQAMQGRFGSTREYGAQLHKDNQEGLKAQLTALAPHAPIDAIKRFMTGDVQAPVQPIAAPPVSFGTDPAGNAYGLTGDNKGGKPTLSYAPKPLSVTNTNSVGGRAEIELDKAHIGQLETARKDLAPFVNDFGRLQRVQELLNKGAAVGGLATPLQSVRKFAQGFGVNIPETGLTDELRSKLGEAVLPNARALAPVTKDDTGRLDNIFGSIDTDPNALRELVAFAMAKHLVTINQHNAQVDLVAGTNPEYIKKYEPFKLKLPTGKFDPALAFRAMQILKENGHDVSMFNIQGVPVSDMTINMDSQKPSAARAPMPPGFTRK